MREKNNYAQQTVSFGGHPSHSAVIVERQIKRDGPRDAFENLITATVNRWIGANSIRDTGCYGKLLSWGYTVINPECSFTVPAILNGWIHQDFTVEQFHLHFSMLIKLRCSSKMHSSFLWNYWKKKSFSVKSFRKHKTQKLNKVEIFIKYDISKGSMIMKTSPLNCHLRTNWLIFILDENIICLLKGYLAIG